MKKNFKLVLALVLAMMMIVGSISALAVDKPNMDPALGNVNPEKEVASEFGGGDFDATNPDNQINVMGITDGDTYIGKANAAGTVKGDPRNSTAARGKRYLDQAIDMLTRAVKDAMETL